LNQAFTEKAIMNTRSTINISEVASGIRAVEGDVTLYEETNFNQRSEAIDFIDFHILDRIEGLLQQVDLKEELDRLKWCAEKIKDELGKIDIHLFKRLREEIRTVRNTKSSFRRMIREYLGNDIMGGAGPDRIGYDHLDIFTSGLLSDQRLPEATLGGQPEMIFYQKTPARIIFEMIELAKLSQDDVFFDLGSGMGQVTMLVNLMSGAEARGIEYEPAYSHYASACASRLNLTGVEFINADARKGDYSQGTVFFLYTPFEGRMLQDVLDLLQKESQKRTIRIFTYGRCSLHVVRQCWLSCINGKADNPNELCGFSTRPVSGYFENNINKRENIII
jgi:hypothetical protein